MESDCDEMRERDKGGWFDICAVVRGLATGWSITVVSFHVALVTGWCSTITAKLTLVRKSPDTSHTISHRSSGG